MKVRVILGALILLIATSVAVAPTANASERLPCLSIDPDTLAWEWDGTDCAVRTGGDVVFMGVGTALYVAFVGVQTGWCVLFEGEGYEGVIGCAPLV
ncbi:MAG TPA: hypothetical protein VNZ52_16010 [Candidatus Thermoplasmatota archaeon]|nr:hypothetical protein [Candidatus Thermoplasmatota archaeon]